MRTFITMALVLCVSCGALKDQEKNEATHIAASIACNVRPKILAPLETFTASFTLPTGAPIEMSKNVGTTDIFLDWGTLAMTTPLEALYTAPAFIPNARKIEIVAKSADASGACPFYVIPPLTYGVPDDGQVIGIPISIYKVAPTPVPTTIPNLDLMVPTEKSVLRALDVPNMGQPFLGITKETSFFYRARGVVNVETPSDYQITFFSHSSSTAAKIDGTVLVSGTPVIVALSAGKHNIEISGIVASGVFQMRLLWAKRINASSFETPAKLVPASAFDRQ